MKPTLADCLERDDVPAEVKEVIKRYLYRHRSIEDALPDFIARYNAILELFDGFLYLCSPTWEKELQKAIYALHGRTRELNLLYVVSQLMTEAPDFADIVFQGTVQMIPTTFQFPEICCARIIVEDQEYKSEDFEESPWKLTAEILFSNQSIGEVQVYYVKEKPEKDEGPFLKEEQSLLEAVARELGKFVARKRTEIALRENEEKYRLLVENIGEGITIVSSDGTFLFSNRAADEIFGVGRVKLIGKKVQEFTDLKMFQLTKERTQIQHKKKIVFEQEITRPDGEKRQALFTLTPQLNIGGNFVGIFGTIRDITERKWAEEKLQRASATVEDLNESLRIVNSILRHDLLNDLTIIRGLLEIYKLEKNENNLEKAYKITDKSVALITRMRELEHLILHDEALKPFNAREIVETVVSNYADSGIEINIKGEGIVLADPALESTIGNVIQNTLVHANTERIDITIDEQEDWCDIRIADYGIGIPDEIKSKIFEPGFKYGKTGHMGLGLYIVNQVIKRYGGTLWIENNIPNGTVFVLKLKTPDKRISNNQ
ncbi:MAG: ATP-binding protein [Promethearchaeota archaeon]